MSDFAADLSTASTPQPIIQYADPTSASDPGLDSAIGDALGIDDVSVDATDDATDVTETPAATTPEAPTADELNLDDEYDSVGSDEQADVASEEPDAATQDPPAEGADAAAAVTESAIPEGVAVRKVDGKTKWVLDPEAGKAAFARAALVGKAEEIFGEPVTEEALQFRQKIVESNELLRNDLLSDNPEDQSRAIAHFEDMLQSARSRGEIGHDAMHGLVRTVLKFGIGSQDASTRENVVRDVLEFTVDDAYNQAISAKDPEQAKLLWGAAQRLELHNFGKFRPTTQLDESRKTATAAAPGSRFSRPAPAATQQTQQQGQADPQQAFNQWTQETDAKIGSDAVAKNVDGALAHISQQLREKHPHAFQSLRDRLVAEVQKGLKADAALQLQVREAVKRARQATSPEIRNQLATSIIQRQAAKAAQILAGSKGPILSDFAHVFAAASTQTRQRIDAGKAASRTVASGSGPSASRTARPAPKTGKFNSSQDFQRELEAEFA